MFVKKPHFNVLSSLLIFLLSAAFITALPQTSRADVSYTEMVTAIANGDVQKVKDLLAKGADPKAKSNNGMQPIHFAVGGGNAEIFNLLLDKGADLKSKDKDGAEPIHFASISGNMEVFKLLLEKGADPNIKDKSGESPIDHARNKKIVALLKSHGAK